MGKSIVRDALLRSGKIGKKKNIKLNNIDITKELRKHSYDGIRGSE